MRAWAHGAGSARVTASWWSATGGAPASAAGARQAPGGRWGAPMALEQGASQAGCGAVGRPAQLTGSRPTRGGPGSGSSRLSACTCGRGAGRPEGSTRAQWEHALHPASPVQAAGRQLAPRRSLLCAMRSWRACPQQRNARAPGGAGWQSRRRGWPGRRRGAWRAAPRRPAAPPAGTRARAAPPPRPPAVRCAAAPRPAGPAGFKRDRGRTPSGT